MLEEPSSAAERSLEQLLFFARTITQLSATEQRYKVNETAIVERRYCCFQTNGMRVLKKNSRYGRSSIQLQVRKGASTATPFPLYSRSMVAKLACF